MERNGMMEAAKRQSYRWWFDSNDDSPGRSQWLHSTLSELDERTKSILRIIEEDADSFAQRAEMYYKKRPQIVSLVEDFYRTHRSLAVQFDHLRNDPATRRTSPLVRSFSLSTGRPQKVIDPLKSYDGCFTKLAYDSEEFCSLPLSKGSPEKPFVGRYTELAYDSEESIDSEVDDPVPEVSYEGVDFVDGLSSAGVVNVADLIDEVDRLQEETMIQKKQLLEKEKAMEELKRKLYETRNEVMELKEETETLRVENVEMYLLKMKDAEHKEQLIAEKATMDKAMKKLSEELGAVRVESQGQKLMLEEKDEEKREAIRQLCVAIEMMKRENLLLKKLIANENMKKWNPFEFQGFRKLFNCSIMSQLPSQRCSFVVCVES